MDISKITTIKSSDSLLPATDKNIVVKEDSPKSITIDEKYPDFINVQKNSEIDATVIKKEANLYSLLLNNNKEITIELDDSLDLKIGDKISLIITDSKITNVKINNVAQNIDLPLKNLISLIKNLDVASNLKNVVENNIPVVIKNNSTANAVINNDLKLEIKLTELPDLAIQKNNSFTFNPEKISLETANNITPAKPNIESINFKDHALKLITPIISSDNNVSSVDLKIIQQTSPKTLNLALNDKIEFAVTLNKPEQIVNKFIEISLPKITQTDNTIKTNSNNVVTSISVPVKTLNNLGSELKDIILKNVSVEVLALKTTQNNIANQFITPLKATESKTALIAPKLADIAFVAPKNLPNDVISANDLKLVINKNDASHTISLQAEDKVINLEKLPVVLNSKEVNTAVFNLLQESTPIKITPEQITFKTPDLTTFVLNLKNNITSLSDVKLVLNENQKIALVPTESNQAKALEIAKQGQEQITAKKVIPSLNHNFDVKLALVFNSVLSTLEATKNLDKDADIFSLILDSIPDSFKPKLQPASQNEALRYFTFPYYQEDDVLKNGEMSYSNNKNKDGSNTSNLAIKVSFSNIGDVMLKLKLNDKFLDVNIYTQIDIPQKLEQLLVAKTKESINQSGFSGTVSVKKSKIIKIPIPNKDKMVYSGIDLKI